MDEKQNQFPQNEVTPDTQHVLDDVKTERSFEIHGDFTIRSQRSSKHTVSDTETEQSKGSNQMWKWILLGVVVVGVVSILVVRSKNNKKSLTFDEYFQKLSIEADKIAARQMRATEKKLAGGKCELGIEPDSQKFVTAVIKLYCKNDADDGWTVRETTLQKPISVFSNDQTTQAKLTQLKSEKMLFDLDLKDIQKPVK